MLNTITLPPPNLNPLLVHWGESHSLGMRRRNLLPSQLNRLNFDSSLKWTQSHCSSIHMIIGKFPSVHIVPFRNLRLRRSNLTVQVYFIKSSGNKVPWYFNTKVNISSFENRSFFFLFITNLSVFPWSSFPCPARLFLGFTWPSFL